MRPASVVLLLALGCSPAQRFVPLPPFDPALGTIIAVVPGPGAAAVYRVLDPFGRIELTGAEIGRPLSLLAYEEPFAALDVAQENGALLDDPSGVGLPPPASAWSLEGGASAFEVLPPSPALELMLMARHRPAPCTSLNDAAVGDLATTVSARVFGLFGEDALALRRTDQHDEVWRLGPSGAAKIFVTTATSPIYAAGPGSNGTLLAAVSTDLWRIDSGGRVLDRTPLTFGADQVAQGLDGMIYLRSLQDELYRLAPGATSSVARIFAGTMKPLPCNTLSAAAFGFTPSGELLSADYSGQVFRLKGGSIQSRETVADEPLCASGYAVRANGEELLSVGKLSERIFSMSSILTREASAWRPLFRSAELHLGRLMTVGDRVFVLGQNEVRELVIRRIGGQTTTRTCTALAMRGVLFGVGTKAGMLMVSSPGATDELHWLTPP